ncbi:hypothetical protein [Microvirga subterranea]|uniref:Outer membrane lipoprotein-sorting protein n=1 Tax=Microvirga subterranea TaxID=186651 RepID=A0A370HM56_9HYPH|nr:hypothetical protein [Microvirga subterranea]RDI59517.1 hypothetical protein DES45_104433 [Microvirga subterranea]
MTAIGMRRGAGALFSAGIILACSVASFAQAGALAPGRDAWNEASDIRFDPTTRETRLTSRVTPGLCFSVSLPQEWRMTAEDGDLHLTAAGLPARLEISLRSAHDLQDLPQADLAHRDAAFLQRDYEGLLGRPAQSVSLTSPAPGATRWSATWVDASLPSPSRAMTVDALIVPLSNEWVLELSLHDVQEGEVHDALSRRILTGLRVNNGAACRG